LKYFRFFYHSNYTLRGLVYPAAVTVPFRNVERESA